MKAKLPPALSNKSHSWTLSRQVSSFLSVFALSKSEIATRNIIYFIYFYFLFYFAFYLKQSLKFALVAIFLLT